MVEVQDSKIVVMMEVQDSKIEVMMEVQDSKIVKLWWMYKIVRL